MSNFTVLFYREGDDVPALDWMDGLPVPVRDRFRVRISRLEELGNQLHRPEADFLRDGIYELRVERQHVNYRLLYFFSGTRLVVVAHGITKEDKVPDREIDLALRRKAAFEADPAGHHAEL